MVGRCSGKWKNYFDMTYYYNRGIRVCESWKNNYDNFRSWALENGYEDDLSIDRINPDGNYEPENCRWIPLNVNKGLARKSPRIYVDYKGERISIVELSKITGISYSTLRGRLRRGIPPENAVHDGSIERRKTVTINERIKFIREDLGMSQTKFAESLGIGQTTVSYIEKKDSTVKEQHVKLICKVHNVNYFWLTEGKGEPYLSPPPVLMDDVVEKYKLDDFDKIIVEEYVKLNSDTRDAVKKLIINIMKRAPE